MGSEMCIRDSALSEDEDASSETSVVEETLINTDQSKNSLEDKVAALETLIASRGDQWNQM